MSATRFVVVRLALAFACIPAAHALNVGRRVALRGAASAAAVSVGSQAANAVATLEDAAFSAGDTRKAAGRSFFEYILPPVRERMTVRTAIGIGENGDGMWEIAIFNIQMSSA